MTDPLDLERLEAVARAATPGPWEVFECGSTPTLVAHEEVLIIATHDHDAVFCVRADAEFAATFNPATALALIAALRVEQARVRAAEADHAKQAERISNLKWDMDCVAAQLDIRTREDLPTAVMRFQQQATKRAEVAESRLSALQAEVRALREQVKAIVEAYDGYRGRGVLPAPDEYQRMVQAIETARAASPSSDAKEPA